METSTFEREFGTFVQFDSVKLTYDLCRRGDRVFKVINTNDEVRGGTNAQYLLHLKSGARIYICLLYTSPSPRD